MAGLVGAADIDATDEVCAEAASGFCFRTIICGGIFAGSESGAGGTMDFWRMISIFLSLQKSITLSYPVSFVII